jgi:hypothetical protein
MSDLVRNLLMSSVANESPETQEKLYTKLWLHPIEAKCQGPSDLSEKLGAFQSEQARKLKKARYVSDLEKKSKEISKAMSKEKTQSIIAYTEFFSFYEFKILQKMMPAPKNLVGRKVVDASKVGQTRKVDDSKIDQTRKIDDLKVGQIGNVDDLKDNHTDKVTTLKSDGIGRVKFAVEKSEEVDFSKVDPQSVYSASMQILADFAAWISDQK